MIFAHQQGALLNPGTVVPLVHWGVARRAALLATSRCSLQWLLQLDGEVPPYGWSTFVFDRSVLAKTAVGCRGIIVLTLFPVVRTTWEPLRFAKFTSVKTVSLQKCVKTCSGTFFCACHSVSKTCSGNLFLRLPLGVKNVFG